MNARCDQLDYLRIKGNRCLLFDYVIISQSCSIKCPEYYICNIADRNAAENECKIMLYTEGENI